MDSKETTIQDLNNLRCTKCQHPDIQLRYMKGTSFQPDMLKCICPTCGFQWEEYPADSPVRLAHEEQKAKQQFMWEVGIARAPNQPLPPGPFGPGLWDPPLPVDQNSASQKSEGLNKPLTAATSSYPTPPQSLAEQHRTVVEKARQSRIDNHAQRNPIEPGQSEE